MPLLNIDLPDSILLPTACSRLGAVNPDERRVTASIPTSVPLPGQGLDLDYTPLLVVKTLTIDRGTYDHCQHSPFSCHKTLFETLRVLRDEGFVVLRDLDSILSRHLTFIESEMNERALREPSVLAPFVQEAIQLWNRAQPALRNALGQDYSEHVSIPIGIAHYLSLEGHPITADKAKAVEKVIFAKKRCRSTGEQALLRAVATPYFSYVHKNLILREQLDMPFIDWDDIAPFYRYSPELPSSLGSDATQRAMQNVRLLYQQPGLKLRRPTNVYELLQLLRHEDIDEARQKFLETGFNRERTDRDWLESQQRRALWAHYKAGKVRTLWLFLGPARLLIPHPLEQGISAVVEKFSDSRAEGFRWLYAIMKTEEWDELPGKLPRH